MIIADETATPSRQHYPQCYTKEYAVVKSHFYFREPMRRRQQLYSVDNMHNIQPASPSPAFITLNHIAQSPRLAITATITLNTVPKMPQCSSLSIPYQRARDDPRSYSVEKLPCWQIQPPLPSTLSQELLSHQILPLLSTRSGRALQEVRLSGGNILRDR